MNKVYYSRRNGVNHNIRLGMDELTEYFDDILTFFERRNSFWVLDKEAEDNYDLFTIEKLGKKDLLPFDTDKDYLDDDIFDLIELYYDYIEPISETDDFRSIDFRFEYRRKVNRVITKYGEGFYLTEEGEVRKGVTDGLDILVNSEITIDETEADDVKNSNEVEEAKALFLHHKSSETDKRNALLILGRVLEENRKELKTEFMSKDESDLFLLLNKYNIRHSDLSQKKDYPTDVYFDWMFYNLLAAIDAFYKIRSVKDDN
ncbi:hypothetical protein [Sutcliffiella deserti]|uniref:hypothetical protein n=1 Tax=Sutcliffiella deserti TaxID=2875501 RepID=UPI001CBC8F10|nr:hypothetical protein [Sutcliffiella deserti]